MDRTHTLLSLLPWVGRGIILVLCILMGLLWGRMERQVARNQADIAAIKAYADVQAQRLRDEATAEQTRLENRWGNYLMPVLRQHHHTLESLLAPDGIISRPETRAPMPPLPAWLQESP